MKRKSSKKYKVKSIKLSEAKSRNAGEKVDPDKSGEIPIHRDKKLIPTSREKSRFIGKRIEKSNSGKTAKKTVEISESKGESVKKNIRGLHKEKEIKPIIRKTDKTGKKPKNKKEKIKDVKTLPVANSKVELSTDKKIKENKTASDQKNKTAGSINDEGQKIVQEQLIKEAGKVQKQEKHNSQKTTIQKSASIGWKYFLDKQGNPLMKIYTENSLVYFKLEKYGEIKKSARYYTQKGDLIGADFIVPFNLITTACGLAGIQTPKGIPAVVAG